MENPEHKCFRVEVPVRPNRKHPTFSHVECAIAHVFLAAADTADAGTRATAILKLLNFELARPPYSIAQQPSPPPKEASMFQNAQYTLAMCHGISLTFDWLRGEVPGDIKDAFEHGGDREGVL